MSDQDENPMSESRAEIEEIVKQAFRPLDDESTPVVPAEEKPLASPMEVAAAEALRAAHGATKPFGLNVLVIVYSETGAYYCSYPSQLSVTAAVGLFQRAAFSVHMKASSE